MLALFDTYDNATRELLRSLETARIAVVPVVIRYEGDLPEGALCPFTTYTGLKLDGRPLFFNEVPVPQWCEIRQGQQVYGEILRHGSLIGRIHYEASSFRQVESVDWLLPDHTPGHTDHYDRYGNRYATTHYSGGIAYQTIYRGPGEWSIEVNHVSRTVTMRSARRLLTFASLTDLVCHFIDDLRLDDDRVVINSLSYPLFVTRRRAREPNTTLFWQEPMPGEVPENMDTELEHPRALERIVFSDERLYRKVVAGYPDTRLQLGYLSHLAQFADKQGFEPKRVFTLTSSDDVLGLEQLLGAFPDVTFSVAALTLMSDKLEALGRRYPNLTLTPSINHSGIRAELDKASVYLDTNAGGQVLDVVKAAFYLNLVVLAVASRAKAPDHERTFPTIDDLAGYLATVVESEAGRSEALEELHVQRGPQSSIADYERVLQPAVTERTAPVS